MGLCMRCARLNKLDGPTKSQLSQSAPPSTWPTQTSSQRWPSQQPRWPVRQRRQRQLFVAAVDISTDAAPAVSPVPVLAPTEPAPDASREKPYICHSWKWRGHKINYATAGCGKPILLVHGFGASIGHFRKNIPALCEAGYKVYAVDLLAFGASDKPILDYTIEMWQDLVLDFMAEFVDGPAVLVGNSLGSLIALATLPIRSPDTVITVQQAAAEASDSAVAGVVLINCAGGMNNKAIADDWRIKLAMPVFLLVDALLARPKVARYLFDRFRTRENIRAVLMGVYSDATAIDDALLDLIYDPSCDVGALEAFVSIISGPPGPRPEQLLERISAPVLVLWGDRDTFTPIDGPVGRFFRRLPETRDRTKVQILPGVGHCPHDDVPALVNDAVIAWLREHH